MSRQHLNREEWQAELAIVLDPLLPGAERVARQHQCLFTRAAMPALEEEFESSARKSNRLGPRSIDGNSQVNSLSSQASRDQAESVMSPRE